MQATFIGNNIFWLNSHFIDLYCTMSKRLTEAIVQRKKGAYGSEIWYQPSSIT